MLPGRPPVVRPASCSPSCSPSQCAMSPRSPFAFGHCSVAVAVAVAVGVGVSVAAAFHSKSALSFCSEISQCRSYFQSAGFDTIVQASLQYLPLMVAMWEILLTYRYSILLDDIWQHKHLPHIESLTHWPFSVGLSADVGILPVTTSVAFAFQAMMQVAFCWPQNWYWESTLRTDEHMRDTVPNRYCVTSTSCI